MDELDHILLDQIHSLRRQLKTIKRLKKLLYNEHILYVGEEAIEKRIRLFESFIHDKSLLQKKHKIKRIKSPDVLKSSQFITFIRIAATYSTVYYKILGEYWESYSSLWKNNKKEK